MSQQTTLQLPQDSSFFVFVLVGWLVLVLVFLSNMVFFWKRGGFKGGGQMRGGREISGIGMHDL